MKLFIFIFLSFYSFGQVQDTLGKKIIATLVELKEEVEIIDMCDGYIEANFIGGTLALLEYITKHLEYPDCASYSLGSKIYVAFTVEKDGELSEIEVLRSQCPELSAKVIELFEEMPLWSPASDVKHGALKAHMRMPIQICFQ